MKRSREPDYLFVEPSSMVVTRELRDVSRMALRDVKYEIGAFITLIDGDRFESWWVERRELLIGQLTGADIVALGKSDLTRPEERERIWAAVGAYTNGVPAIDTTYTSAEEILRMIG